MEVKESIVPSHQRIYAAEFLGHPDQGSPPKRLLEFGGGAILPAPFDHFETTESP